MYNPTYLSVSRHGIYYFRMPVPKSKRSLIGKAEIKKSLRTRDPKEALKRARKEWMREQNQISTQDGNTAFTVVGDDPLGEAKAAAALRRELQGTAPAQESSVPTAHLNHHQIIHYLVR